MDNVFLLDAARAGHMVGLAAGLGLALCADVLAVKSVFTAISKRDVWMLRALHRMILCGLVLLWVTGIILLQVRTGWEWANFTPKLITKLIVVVLLSGNALMIGRFALPCYGQNTGRCFGAFDLGSRLRLSGIAGMSLSCWLSALALGVFSQLKPMSFESLQAIFAPVFLVGLAGAVLVGLGAALVNRLEVASMLAARQSGKDWPSGPDIGRVQTRAIHS